MRTSNPAIRTIILSLKQELKIIMEKNNFHLFMDALKGKKFTSSLDQDDDND